MRSIAAALCLAVVAFAVPANADEVADGLTPRWLAINPHTQKLYVANTGSNNVSVIDLKTSKVIASIPVEKQPDRVVVDADANRVYVSNMASNSVSVIDGDGDTVLKTIAVGAGPAGLALDAANHRLFVACLRAKSIASIKTEDGEVEWETPTRAQPGDVCFDPVRRCLYVSLDASGADGYVAVIPFGAAAKPFEVTVSAKCYYLFLDPIRDRLYAIYSRDGGDHYVDLKTFKAGALCQTNGVIAMAADPATNGFYMTLRANENGGNTFHAETLQPGQTFGKNRRRLAGLPNPAGLAVNPATHLVYIAESAMNAVVVYDPQSQKYLGSISLQAKAAGQQ